MTALKNYIDELSNPMFLLDDSGDYILYSNRAAAQEHGLEQDDKLQASVYIKTVQTDYSENLIAEFNHQWYALKRQKLTIAGEDIHMLGLYTIEGHPDKETLDNWKNMIAVLLHRLRSPLTGISGYVELLEEENKDNSLNKRIESIHKGFSQVYNMMDELEIFYHTSDKYDDSEFIPVNLSKVVSTLVLNFSKEEQARIKVKGDTSSEPHSVDSSCDYLKTVLGQLLKNSLEHSEGEVHINIDANNGGSIELHNPNPGVPEDIKSKMFHPFVTTKANELGIGLTIALLYAQKLGGILLFKENDELISFKLKLPLN